MGTALAGRDRRAISQWCGAAFSATHCVRAVTSSLRGPPYATRLGRPSHPTPCRCAPRPQACAAARVQLARDSTFEAAMLHWTRCPVRCRSCPSLYPGRRLFRLRSRRPHALARHPTTPVETFACMQRFHRHQAHRRSYSQMRRCVIRGQARWTAEQSLGIVRCCFRGATDT
ncbi:hypothetical protein B0H14DRAFT_2927223 [Mycena olivaceomarginata]|nr:hypothetical protein B0H14DRAFT_2927223 [Mycena olivaceomarginata]